MSATPDLFTDPSTPGEGTPDPAGFAYEIDGRRVPAERFYAIACDPARSVAVEACAGAGKTWMLVSRILRALLEGVPAHEILAITFTKKAAGEMRQRLQDWLRDFSRQGEARLRQELGLRGLPAARAAELAPQMQGLYAQLLAGGRPVQIRTFHSWFAALLRTAPLATLEALGLPARGELLEDDAEAIARVWRPFQDRVAGDPQARQDFEASVAAHGRSQTRKALEAALAKRVEFDLADAQGVVDASVSRWPEVFADLVPAGWPDDDLPAGPGRLLSKPGAVQEQLWAAARVLGASTLKTCTDAANRLEQALGAGDLQAVVDALITDKGTARKFSEKLEGLDTVRAAQDLALRLQAAEVQHQAWLHQGRMSRLARLLLQEYAALKRAQGWVDMSDVERAALDLLSDPVLSGWVQERLDARVSQLLVDEFQDTNPLQWQALHAWLSGYAGAGGGGGAPSVFIVGDPKQSIYRFRRAEPQVFRAAQRFVVEGLGGTLLGCDHTRRNAPEVLAAVNQAMLAAQAAGDYAGFRAHTTAAEDAGEVVALPPVPRPARDEAAPAEAGPAWRDSLTEPREEPEEKLLALECRQAAAWLAGRIAGGLAPGHIMVLARKRDRLVAMEEALRARGIPAQQADKTELGETPEVEDLVALFDVLVSPTHDLSLARALKSPVFGASDADLAALALRAREARAMEDIGEDGRPLRGPAPAWLDLLLQGGWTQHRLAEAAERLATWRRWVEAWPPHDALDSIFHDGQVLARYAAAAPAPARAGVLANLRALLQAALEVSGGRYLTPYAFVRALRAGGQRAPAVAAEGAVQLLTVHGAKGLEAKLVLLLDTDGSAPRAETMGVLVDWPGEEAAPLRFVFLASESRPPACCESLLAREKVARANEELNALYVAMTRARQSLALSSIEPHKANAGSWWQRLEALCVRLPVTEAADVSDVADVMDVVVDDEAIRHAQDPEEREAGRKAGGSVKEAANGTTNGATSVAANVAASLPAIRLLTVPGHTRVITTPPADAGASAEEAEDTLRARFGEALHRLLEGVPLGGVPAPGEGWPAGLLQRVAREFGLNARALGDAVAMADRILGGEGAWCWDPDRVDWADNEVPLHVGGELRRIDRLVRVRGEAAWWVLDYKSAARPEDDGSLRAQLAQYRDAVMAAHPGETVHAAFLTGQGRLVPL